MEWYTCYDDPVVYGVGVGRAVGGRKVQGKRRRREKKI